MDLMDAANLSGDLGDFVGAVAVVATLVYLTVQLRQNTSALRSNSWQAIQDAEQRFDALLAGNVALADIWVRGAANGLDSFADQTERMRFLMTAKQLVDMFQTHHYQYDAGMIEDEMWGTWITQYDEELANSPGFCDVIRERYRHLRPSFRKFVGHRSYSGGS